MNNLKHLTLVKNNVFYIIIACILAAIIGFLYHNLDANFSHSSTIFISFAGSGDKVSSDLPQENASQNNLIYAVDAFTESAQGWFLNPKFIADLNAEAPGNSFLGAKKQEKQNLIINYKSVSADAGNDYRDAISSNLQKYLQNYNDNSDLNFNLSIFDHLQTEAENSPLKTIVIADIVALLASLGTIYLISEAKKL